jgi:hypothetical protein
MNRIYEFDALNKVVMEYSNSQSENSECVGTDTYKYIKTGRYNQDVIMFLGD